MRPLPLIAPDPPRLSDMGDALRRVEASGVFTNHGPEARGFEAAATQALFGGRGATLAVANATLGLTIAIADAVGTGGRGRMALMPALTFAATAQAAWWAGLVPLPCDVDPDDWAACARAEETLLRRHGSGIAAIVPYAAFGRAIDLDRYRFLAARHGVAVVVDAAASLGTRVDGTNFGAGAPFPIVFSMHATKPFAVAEGGLVHCGEPATIARLRTMAGFGFGRPREATMPGLNAKLPEVLAVMARAKLDGFEDAMARRETVAVAYRATLPAGCATQPAPAERQALGFFPVRLPEGTDRDAIVAALAAEEIGAGAYFSPHLGEQQWVRSVACLTPTPVADDLSRRILSLPLTDAMTAADAHRVTAALARALTACASIARGRGRGPRGRSGLGAPVSGRPMIHDTIVIGGGPAGTALLTAAAKAGLLPALARGLAIVERGPALGAGTLGGYAITSDSSADTFLTAIADHPQAEIAALADHPAAHRVAAHRASLGVPLTAVGGLLDALGDRLAQVVAAQGGTVLTGHEAVSARRGGDGLWHVRLRGPDGRDHVRVARSLVVATGGHQPIDRLTTQRIAGVPIADLADGRLVQSDAVLKLGGTDMIADLVAGRRNPRIAVVGGSTSALTTVAALLKAGLPLGAGAVTLLHRRPLRPFYPSAAAARAEGFTDFGPDDICPISGFVYRLAGFRLEARDLVLRMLAVDGRVPDPRVAVHRIAGDNDTVAQATVRAADVVIAALGYRPRALAFERADGTPLPLAADSGAAMVDRDGCVVGADGIALPGVYGIGLAAGFVPWGRLGGEASFRGQANGLWLWQNDVGRMIVDRLLADRAAVAA
ncbi:aminotransferase DegT [Sphingomonas sp. Leaf412]|uniref:DegT/DnrJ/EryC1/StrS family aminotransferase n=1 Tax=Sphingomonas sp. Leaf412 TaxID=1736370 RepID=UPI0006F9BEF4|nr:DegT/DnrJ/EryC1/StrS family aminotransferase [Sphingomonas sp. Leaf412]KQT32885.1 aminotransferase DegT [Sphingomonas sp. Leaf412]